MPGNKTAIFLPFIMEAVDREKQSFLSVIIFQTAFL